MLFDPFLFSTLAPRLSPLIKELQHQPVELLGVLHVWHVAAVLEDMQAGPGDPPGGIEGLAHGQDAVLAAPRMSAGAVIAPSPSRIGSRIPGRRAPKRGDVSQDRCEGANGAGLEEHFVV